MKIQSVASPHAIQQPSGNTQAQQDAKARAIAKLSPTPVIDNQTPIPVNANAIAPEDVSAVKQATVEQREEQAAPQEEAPEVKAEETESKQLQLLVRKERALRAQAQKQQEAFKTREAALAAREQELTERAKKYDTEYVPKERLRKDYDQVLAEEGIDYDQYTQRMIEREQVNPHVRQHISKLEQQIQELRQNQEASNKAQVEAQSEQYKAAIHQIQSDVHELVKSDPTYEMIKATNSQRDVTELIELTFKEDKRVMSVEEAANEVEQHLLQEAEKLARINKVQQRLKPSNSGTPEQAQTLAPQKQPQQMKTITNAAGSTRQLSAKERAILAFRNELK